MFVWSESAGLIDLGVGPGTDANSGAAFAINNSSYIVGSYNRINDFSLLGFLWTPQNGMIDIGKPAEDGNCIPVGINDKGQIVATRRWSPNADPWNIREPDGTWHGIGFIPGIPNAPYANDINSDGTVVGRADTNGDPEALVYYPGVGMRRLYDLCDASKLGWKLHSAKTINEQGVICGFGWYLGSFNFRGFLAIPFPEKSAN